MKVTFQLLLLALVFASVRAAKEPADTISPTELSDKSVHVAYDDGLEPDEADEESSARARGLDDTLVRSLVSVSRAALKDSDEHASGSGKIPFSAIKTEGLLGKDSIDALQALASRFEKDLTTRRKTKKQGEAVTAKELSSAIRNAKAKTPSAAKKSKGKEKPSVPVVADISTVVRNDDEMTKVPDSEDTSSSKKLGKGKPSSIKEPASQKEEDTSVPSQSRILIGKEKFARERVTVIGDIDANGYKDYIVSSPKENQECGAIRLYLMKKGDAVKAERHVIPGKWGFFHKSLSKGDLFGSSVLPIGDVNRDGVDDIAIGAPGDKESGTAKGAVYILLMKSDGSVLHTQKVSATTNMNLGRQLQPGEGFGARLARVADINGDEVPEVKVGSLDGSSTLLFLSKEGDAHASIKFHGSASIRDILSVRQSKSTAERLVSKAINFSTKAASDTCYFTDTHCQCETTGISTTKCLDAKETLSDGRTKCEERDCKPSYKCSCGGEQFCTHSSVSKTVFVADDSAGGNLLYCHSKKVQMEEVKLLPGAPVPEAEDANTGGTVGVWSDTKCACSSKATLRKSTGDCTEFDHKTGSESFCNVRQCASAPSTSMECDITGKSLCSRGFETKSKYVDDGPTGKFHKCHLVSEQVEVATCTENCPQ